VSYLNQPDLLNRVDSCLQHTYDFSFIRARQIQKELLRLTPGHPAPLFLEALIVYWENFPLTPNHDQSDRFIDLMTRTVKMAEKYIDSEQTHLEGVFFDLFGRAFKAMYWADNGKSGKVVPDLRTMYRYTKEGFELKEAFNEFYFSTGLYNYYIEAYPEAHPVYKPLVSFMQGGDKQMGLQQLNYAINNSIFLKVESTLFMSLIQLNYEKDLNTAAIFAERLHGNYPRNRYYQGHLITILLHQHRYQQVLEVMDSMKAQDDAYSEMIRFLADAFIAEKQTGDQRLAGKRYQKTIEKADTFGPFADLFKAMGYMGLSRLHERKGLKNEAKRYARKASKLTVYSFILNE
jgi:hypothetical protein